jgi:ElaB/YqjD/DUF883 family membrane-anchored ribosome-binding protein
MNATVPTAEHHARALRRVATATVPSLEGPAERIGEIARALLRRVRQRPFMAVAAAIGAGFVLGGALSFRAGRIALGAAARHVAREFLKQVL